MAESSLEPGKVMMFAKNIQHVGQQKENRLVPYVDANLAFTDKGDRFTDETFGLSNPVDALTDWADSPEGHVPQYRRVAFGKMYHDGKYVGEREDAEKLISPKNGTVEAMAFGRERRRDEMILTRGVFAASMLEINQAGDYQTAAFPAANIVAVDDIKFYRGRADGTAAPAVPGAGAGLRMLTPAKIRAAKKILADGKDDRMGQMPVILYEEEDLMGLLTSSELTDADLTQVKRLENGEIKQWMGCTWVKVDPGLLPKVPGQASQWYTAMFIPKYLAYKDRPLVRTRITERADKSYNWYAYYRAQDFLLRRRDTAFVWVAMERAS